MALKIGFAIESNENTTVEPAEASSEQVSVPRKSLVEIYFAGRGMTLTYYNDQFDLHCGDRVYVDGKLEGMCGQVTSVSYNFKIKLSDYKRVIAVVDTTVHGKFFSCGSHLITFDPAALPGSKAITWFKSPVSDEDEDEYVCGYDDSSFPLVNLNEMNVTGAIFSRGGEYYAERKVEYISLDGSKGYAVVVGREPYEVEFEYRDGTISRLTCSCFCSYNCKHEVAAMMQLSEVLDIIKKNYSEEFARSGYFAAIGIGTLMKFAVAGKENGWVLL